MRISRSRILATTALLVTMFGSGWLSASHAEPSAASAASGEQAAGRILTRQAPSAALAGEAINYKVYLPAGYDQSADRYPTLYLLHGRGDTMAAWTRVKRDLDSLIADGSVPPVIVVMPDAPWSERGSYYVNSRYTGTEDPGRPVERALTRDLVNHVDATYRTVPQRSARAVGGYSMGAYGALRYVLAHQDTFAAGLVLSPAVYVPLPPPESSARQFGAFGKGSKLFHKRMYQRANYPAELRSFDPNLPVHLYIAVGDDEWVNPDPDITKHDLDFEAAKLYNHVKRVDGVTAEFRVVDGGHSWEVWAPQFVRGVQELASTLGASPTASLGGWGLGTDGDDRAGGVTSLPSGDVAVAAAVAGALGGEPHAGGLDVVVTRRGTDGTPRWTTGLGTEADERAYGLVTGTDGDLYTAGYTSGNLDGDRPGNPSDDVFVARLGADGNVAWRLQFGDPSAADRAYALAADPGGGVVVAGYTKGSVAGTPNRGDKDAFVAKVSAEGELDWVRQFGSRGEDKGLAVTVDVSGVYLGGVAGAAMPGAHASGGIDGWLAALDRDGTMKWLSQVGTSADDQLTGVTTRSGGGVVAVGWSSGTIGTSAHGGDDIIGVALGQDGTVQWSTQVGSAGDDRAADVTARPDGSLVVAGYTDGRMAEGRVGGVDIVSVHLSADGSELGTTQLGTPAGDGADVWAEENLYLTRAGDGSWLSGLTYGSTTGHTNNGAGDVFVTPLSPEDRAGPS